MSKKQIKLIIIMVSCCLTFGLLTYNNVSAQDTYELRINAPMPESPPSVHPASQGIAYFKEKLEENTNGRIKVNIHWGGSLYPDDSKQYSAIRKGKPIQMGESSGGRMGNEIPETFFMGLPFLFEDMEHVRRFIYGDDGNFEPNGPGYKVLKPIYEENGYKLVSIWQYGLQNYVSRKEFLESTEDFKGQKLRVRQSDLAGKIQEALGASAQSIPYMETYTALSMGTVDGAECPLAVIQSVKWHEAGDYITLTQHSLLYMAWIVNPEWYNSLPNDLQNKFDETMVQANKFEYNTQQELEHKMPWDMMMDRPSLMMKGVSDDNIEEMKEATEKVRKEYKKKIDNDDLWEALEKTRAN